MQDGDRDLFRLLEPVVSSQGLDLVEARRVGPATRPILRIVIHSPEGVSHADCARVTRASSEAIEEAGVLPGGYVLEVSSAGLERVLQEPREFDLFRGRPVRVRMAEGDPVEIRGIVGGVREGDTVVVLQEDGGESLIEWSRVRKARLIAETPGRRDGGGS
jgi:ribosome maturation factor RimP